MSRVNKLWVKIPNEINFSINENKLKIKGPKGELSKTIPTDIDIVFCGESIQIVSKIFSKTDSALCGTYRGHIQNMIMGVSVGFKKKLELQGIGYKAHVDKKVLVLNVGYSHPVFMSLPHDVEVSVENSTLVTVFGLDKELVGHVAASIRLVKPPEPYKGKGIRYQGEYVRRKIGKAGKK